MQLSSKDRPITEALPCTRQADKLEISYWLAWKYFTTNWGRVYGAAFKKEQRPLVHVIHCRTGSHVNPWRVIREPEEPFQYPRNPSMNPGNLITLKRLWYQLKELPEHSRVKFQDHQSFLFRKTNDSCSQKDTRQLRWTALFLLPPIPNSQLDQMPRELSQMKFLRQGGASWCISVTTSNLYSKMQDGRSTTRHEAKVGKFLHMILL